MDMSKMNEDILNEDENADLGPRIPDGVYILSATAHEEKTGDYEQDENGEWPQFGFYVTFVICEGDLKGKEYKQYFNYKHPTSEVCQKYGRIDLKKFYKAINFIPEQFTDVYGKRFKAQIENKKNDPGSDYAYSTKIIKWGTAPAAKGQTFQETVKETQEMRPGDPVPGNTQPTGVKPPDNASALTPPAGWNAQQEIDEIPF